MHHSIHSLKSRTGSESGSESGSGLGFRKKRVKRAEFIQVFM